MVMQSGKHGGVPYNCKMAIAGKVANIGEFVDNSSSL